MGSKVKRLAMKIREKSSGSLHKRTHQPGPRRTEALDVSVLRGNKKHKHGIS